MVQTTPDDLLQAQKLIEDDLVEITSLQSHSGRQAFLGGRPSPGT